MRSGKLALAAWVFAAVSGLSACNSPRPPAASRTPGLHDTALMQVGEPDFHQPGKLRFVVDVADPDRCVSSETPQMVRALFRLLPALNRQRCRNNYGYSFRREAQDTELPHLLEHVALELQSQARPPHGVIRGETVWNWKEEQRGRFHVELDYEDRRVAAAAVTLAERLIETFAEDADATIDLEAEVAALRKPPVKRLSE